MKSSSRNGARVRLLAVHTTEGIMRAADLRAWATWPGSSHASADQYGALLDGAADGFVDYARAAWTLRDGNPISDNLELCALAKWTRAQWLAKPLLIDRCARWLARRHLARPWIPLVKLSPADVRAGKSGVIGHVDWTEGMNDGTHWDPGPGFPWDVVINKARTYAAGQDLEDDMPLTDADATLVAKKFLDWKLPTAQGDKKVSDLLIEGSSAWDDLIQEEFKKDAKGQPVLTPAWVYLRAAAGLSEQAAQNAARVAGAIQASDPAELAAAIRDQFDDDLVADVAARLRVTPS